MPGAQHGKPERRAVMSKKKTAGIIAIAALCAAAGGLAGAAGYYYNQSMVPKKHDPHNDNDPLEQPYTSGRHWMNEHVRRQDVFTISEDGLQLHGNFILASDPDCHRYAICVHDINDSAEIMGVFARHYYEEFGMSVLLPDLRGFGASEGSAAGLGYKDADDLIRWIYFILERDPDAVIILHGISMGAAAVLTATGRALPDQVLAAIADSSYTTGKEIFRAEYQRKSHRLIPFGMMFALVRGTALVRAHYDIAKVSPLDAVRHSATPTLFIQSEDDDTVPAGMMPRLYEAATCRKDFLWIPDAGHVMGVSAAPKKYWAKVESFLDGITPFILHDNIKDTDPYREEI